ncbi:hypothetical protein PMI16_04821 [Herbaspirillum sp. CF444]|uniref:hypothetical protein n=1 Tax=Herbaspirillum sp. CF444 TaxID=1144319 RepID=UPI0002724691|nr:hypothetical protein [Herbaspirillum sp. CF444]EJL81215.1 hypothetical protein PMI16_04821 [Herbaspirillum sp. CF444]
MSYDLFFNFPQAAQRSAVDEYFTRRQLYKIDSAVVYENPDTGVYFVLEFRNEEGDPNRVVGASLNLNYFRPHIFGLEAEPEIRAFVERFDLAIDDPQMHGMAQGPYTSAGFYSGWNAGNAFGYRAITAENKGPFLSYPEKKAEAVWSWNKQKRALQTRIGESMFVPTVMFATIDGRVQSIVVWGDGIPTLMPLTDVVLVVRDKFAPKPLFRAKQGKDHCLVSPGDLNGLLGPSTDEGYALPVRVPNYIDPGADIVRWIGKLQAFSGDLKLVRPDQVLSEELLKASA